MQTAGQIPQEPAAEVGKALPLDRDQQVTFSRHGIEMRTLADVQRVAQWIVASQWNPKGMGVADCAVAIMRGVGLGMGPIQAVECIAVVNGRATVWGDMMLGLCRRSGRFDEDGFLEWFDNDPNPRKLSPDVNAGKPDHAKDSYTAHCVTKRIGAKAPKAYGYSIGDAKKAGLWTKQGTWQTNPNRMQIYRARAFNLRDNFTDVLQGLYDREEMLDADVVLNQIDLGGEPQAAPIPTGTKSEQLARELARPANLEPTEAETPLAEPEAAAMEEALHPEPPAEDLALLRADILERLMKLPPEAHKVIRKAYGAADVVHMRTIVGQMDGIDNLNDLKLAIVDVAGKAKQPAKGT